MAEITIVKPHDEGKSALEVTVNGEKWSKTRGETVDVPEYIATEVRRSLAQRDSLSLSDRDEREGEPEGGGGGGGGGNAETATIVITVTNRTPTITSGAFPEWCTVANSNNIYGKAELDGVYFYDPTTGEEFEYDYGFFGIQAVAQVENNTMVIGWGGCQNGAPVHIALDLSLVGGGPNYPFSKGTVTINLVYIPN